MFLTHDLRTITNNPKAELNEVRKQLLEEIVRNPSKCLFVYGSAGSGKTQMVTEGFKIKLCQLQNQGKKVRLLVTTFSGLQSDPRELKKKIATQYLANIKDIEVMGLKELCDKELHIDYDIWNPFKTVTKVMSRLSENSK